MSWVIMITNVDRYQASADMLFDIYRLRWQIELLFKCWKSYANINNVKSAGLLYDILVKLGKSCKREKRKRKSTEERLMDYYIPPADWN